MPGVCDEHSARRTSSETALGRKLDQAMEEGLGFYPEVTGSDWRGELGWAI